MEVSALVKGKYPPRVTIYESPLTSNDNHKPTRTFVANSEKFPTCSLSPSTTVTLFGIATFFCFFEYFQSKLVKKSLREKNTINEHQNSFSNSNEKNRSACYGANSFQVTVTLCKVVILYCSFLSYFPNCCCAPFEPTSMKKEKCYSEIQHLK